MAEGLHNDWRIDGVYIHLHDWSCYVGYRGFNMDLAM